MITVVAVSGYASINRDSFASLRLGAVNAEGLVIGEGGEVGNVSLGRGSTIIKQITVPTSAPAPHTPLVYVVNGNEALTSIASRFGLSVDDVRWSNPAVGGDHATNGQRLWISPVPGVVATAGKGDTASTLASRYQVDTATVVDFNYLRGTQLTAGQHLVIPGGRGPKLPPLTSPTPTPQVVSPVINTSPVAPAAAPSTSSGSGGQVSSGGAHVGPYSANRFAYGYCTWYVATLFPVAWLGDAWQWFGNAQAAGYPTGQRPRAGSVMVTWESGWGHVAYVERVNSDGSWVVTEMNYVGWGIVSSRTIRPGQVPLIGFIYHP